MQADWAPSPNHMGMCQNRGPTPCFFLFKVKEVHARKHTLVFLRSLSRAGHGFENQHDSVLPLVTFMAADNLQLGACDTKQFDKVVRGMAVPLESRGSVIAPNRAEISLL